MEEGPRAHGLMLVRGGLRHIRARAWSLRETISLMNHPMLRLLRVDWCMYSTEKQPIKKPTKLLSSAPWLPGVCSCCDRSHRHGAPLRGRRAKLAAAYPARFCAAVAVAYISWSEARGRE